MIRSVILFLSAFLSVMPATADSYGNFLMPGLSGSTLVSLSDGSVLAGGGFHFALLYGNARDDGNGSDSVFFPACWEFFIEVNLYGGVSPTNAGNWLFDYLFGALISFDRSSSLDREFFIPYYGIKIGGVYLNTGFKDDNGMAISPFVGLSFVRTRNFFLNLETGLFMSTVLFRETLSVAPALLLGITF